MENFTFCTVRVLNMPLTLIQLGLQAKTFRKNKGKNLQTKMLT